MQQIIAFIKGSNCLAVFPCLLHAAVLIGELDRAAAVAIRVSVVFPSVPRSPSHDFFWATTNCACLGAGCNREAFWFATGTPNYMTHKCMCFEIKQIVSKPSKGDRLLV